MNASPPPEVSHSKLEPTDVCPACGGALAGSKARSAAVTTQLCPACGHTTARHIGPVTNAPDYHLQYEQDAFLQALRATRERQARRLVEALRAIWPQVDGILDVGAGRGWFLRSCRSLGLGKLAGVDSSELAIDGLTEAGIPGFLTGNHPWKDWPALFPLFGFRPSIITLLDVLEHFPGHQIDLLLSSLVVAGGAHLKYVVIKVPVSEGFLYRTASGIGRLGATGPLDQLFQVGTHPPHFHYFSRRSMHALLDRLNLDVVAEFGDPEFEPDQLVSRVGALAHTPPPFRRMATIGATVVSKLTPLHDTRVFIARPRR